MTGSSSGLLVVFAGLSFLTAVLTAAMALRLPRRPFLLTASVSLWVPALMGALLLPEWLADSGQRLSVALLCGAAVFQGILLSPVISLPSLLTLSRTPSGLSRTAQGLGAGRSERFRFLWLPLLRTRLLCGVACGVALSFTGAWLLVNAASR